MEQHPGQSTRKGGREMGLTFRERLLGSAELLTPPQFPSEECVPCTCHMEGACGFQRQVKNSRW